MLFWFDRLQYLEGEKNNRYDDRLIIYEFFKTSLDNVLAINNNNWVDELGKSIFDQFTYEKHKAIRRIMQNNRKIIYYLIVYQEDFKKGNIKVIAYYNLICFLLWL